MSATEAVRFILLFLFVTTILGAPAGHAEKRDAEQPPDVAISEAHKEADKMTQKKKNNADENANVHVEIKSLPTDSPFEAEAAGEQSEANHEKAFIQKIDSLSKEGNEAHPNKIDSAVVNKQQAIFQDGMIDKLLKEESEKQLTDLANNDDSLEDMSHDTSEETTKEDSVEDKAVAIKEAMAGQANNEENDDVSTEIDKLIAQGNGRPYSYGHQLLLGLLDYPNEELDGSVNSRGIPMDWLNQIRQVSRRRRQSNRRKRATFATEAAMSDSNKHSIRSKREVPYWGLDDDLEPDYVNNDIQDYVGDSEPDVGYYGTPIDSYYEGRDYSDRPVYEREDLSDEEDTSDQEVPPALEYELERAMGLLPNDDTSASESESSEEDDDDRSDLGLELDEPNAQPVVYNGQPGIFVPVRKRQMLSTMPGFKRSFYSEPDAQEGRWRALVPQQAEKRGVMEEYTRLYRLARALHRPKEEYYK